MKEKTIFIKEAIKAEPIQEVESNLMQIDGIERVLIDVEDGELKIAYDERKIDIGKILIEIQQLGLHPAEE